MPTADFSTDWVKQFSDPYAVLGVSVTADEQRILKRYRQIAKQLHPDVQIAQGGGDRAFAQQVLTRLVNPAYQRLKQDKGRAETLATLRFKVRRLTREDKLSPKNGTAQELLQIPEADVEVFYEQALVKLADGQYSSTQQFSQQTSAIAELNLIYLRRKMGDPVIREKRTGLVASGTLQEAGNIASEESQTGSEPAASVNYAKRHVDRAKAYITNKKYSQAIKELQDAVRMDPANCDYHAMLGQAYLLQKMSGMAKVHFRRALKINPRHAIALKYARQLEMDLSDLSSASPKKKGGGLFGLFAKKR